MDAECWKDDSSLLPLPWRSVSHKGTGVGYKSWSGAGGQLRVGVMWDDGHVRPVGCINRGMKRVVNGLKGIGVEVVDVEPIKFKESWEIIVCRLSPSTQV